MKKLTKNGRIKLVSDQTLKLIGGNLDGWTLVHDTRSAFSPRKEPDPVEPNAVNEPNREEMIEYLKERGIKVHFKTGDEKLKARYYEELNIN
jgi:hypothetical protein